MSRANKVETSRSNVYYVLLTQAIRSLTFGVEEIWHPEFYPLQRSDAALDRVTQLIEQLGPACQEINVVKWPRLQDDTVIDQTYSEMQAWDDTFKIFI